MLTHPFSEEEKHRFIQFMLDSNVLCLGDFITKKGRKTPYFINTGLYDTASQIKTLSEFYAKMIHHYFKDKVTNLFGPAYKGIPLATATVIELERQHGMNLSLSFNRKEIKDHGESGVLMGNSYEQQPETIVIIEDVISTGISIKEIFPLVQRNKNNVLGLVVSVDRQEKGDTECSALKELETTLNIKCYSMVTIKEIISFLEKNEIIDLTQLNKIKIYRSKYGAVGS